MIKIIDGCRFLFIFSFLCVLVCSIGAMEDSMQQFRQRSREAIWVRTSDDQLISVPKWQIDQMKVLQMLFIYQDGKNSKKNPIDAFMISSESFTLMQNAFRSMNSSGQFKLFCKNLTPNKKASLINAAFIVEAIGLVSLLAEDIFSPEVQGKLGASVPGIMEPVIAYLGMQIYSKEVLSGHTHFVKCVACSPDGKYIASGSLDGSIILWDAKTKKMLDIIKSDEMKIISCLAFSYDGKQIIYGVKNDLFVWDIATNQHVGILQGHQNFIMCVSCSSDGRYIVSGSVDGSIILWNASENIPLQTYIGHNDRISCIAFNPDSTLFVSGSWDNALIIWDVQTGNILNSLQGHQNYVSCASFFPSGDFIVSGSWDGTLIIWNAATGEMEDLLYGHTDKIFSLACSHDGRNLASGSEDNIIILWDIHTKKQVNLLKGQHHNTVSSLAFSIDDSYIVSGSYDNNCIVWVFVDKKILDFLAKKLTISQARFLYRLYIARINQAPVFIDEKDQDYLAYLSLPEQIKRIIKQFFL